MIYARVFFPAGVNLFFREADYGVCRVVQSSIQNAMSPLNCIMPNHLAYLLPICALDVVVIDDNQSMRKILHTLLNAFGVHRIRLYEDGESALREMKISSPNLVITDWHMKPMNGHRLTRIMRHEKTESLNLVPIIMLTGYATRYCVEKSFDAGVQQFLSKPISPKALLKRIQWVIKDDRELILNNEYYNYPDPVTVLSQTEIDAKAKAGIRRAELLTQEYKKSLQAVSAENCTAAQNPVQGGQLQDELWEL